MQPMAVAPHENLGGKIMRAEKSERAQHSSSGISLTQAYLKKSIFLEIAVSPVTGFFYP